MKNKFFSVVKMVMHSPTEGHKEWIEIIPWTEDRKMYINLKKIEEQENDATHQK